MEQLTRRSFIKGASATALAAACSFYTRPAIAGHAPMSYKLYGSGWGSNRRREIVAAAMDLVRFMYDSSVINETYNQSRGNYYIAGGAWERAYSNIRTNGLRYEDLLYNQLNALGRGTVPTINIYPYSRDDGSAGYVENNDIDAVTVEFSPQGTRVYGEFKFYLNQYYLGASGLASSPALWASVIAHEMLHNLSHLHDFGEYRRSAQINALGQAVYMAAGGVENVVASNYLPCCCGNQREAALGTAGQNQNLQLAGTHQPDRVRVQLEGERYDAQSNVVQYDTIIGYVNDGSWIRVDQVGFANGYSTMTVRYAKGNTTPSFIDVHLDSLDSPSVARFPTSYTGGWEDYVESTVPFNLSTRGTHNVYFSFTEDGVGNIDSISFQ